MREVRRVLLDADVNYKVVKTFVEDVQKRALGLEVLRSITPGQLIVKIMYDELVKMMGTSTAELNFSAMPPTVIMVAGLQGSGKTTFCAKLSLYLKTKGRFPLLAAGDVQRPAALDPIEMLAGEHPEPDDTT